MPHDLSRERRLARQSDLAAICLTALKTAGRGKRSTAAMKPASIADLLAFESCVTKQGVYTPYLGFFM